MKALAINGTVNAKNFHRLKMVIVPVYQKKSLGANTYTGNRGILSATNH